MAEVVQNTQQEFWRPPSLDAVSLIVADPLPLLAASCPKCGAEFIVGSLYCHACGVQRRDKMLASPFLGAPLRHLLVRLQTAKEDFDRLGISFPNAIRYLHFHEIKRRIGLPTAAFVAFLIGLGCMLGAISVGLLYRASNLSEFQAVQLWRIEWLVAATASFVAGILLKSRED